MVAITVSLVCSEGSEDSHLEALGLELTARIGQSGTHQIRHREVLAPPGYDNRDRFAAREFGAGGGTLLDDGACRQRRETFLNDGEFESLLCKAGARHAGVDAHQ